MCRNGRRGECHATYNACNSIHRLMLSTCFLLTRRKLESVSKRNLRANESRVKLAETMPSDRKIDNKVKCRSMVGTLRAASENDQQGGRCTQFPQRRTGDCDPHEAQLVRTAKAIIHFLPLRQGGVPRRRGGSTAPRSPLLAPLKRTELSIHIAIHIRLNF